MDKEPTPKAVQKSEAELRADNLERIAEYREQQEVESNKQSGVDFVPSDPGEKPKEEAPPEVKVEAPPEVKPEPVVEKKYKLKVHGKELELSEAEVLARAQKVEAADLYLQQAAQTLKFAQQPKPEPAKPEELDDTALAQKLQMGTAEEAAEVIRTLRAKPQPTFNVAQIDDRLALLSANQRFNDEFKDIVSDEHLYRLAKNRDKELIDGGDTRPYYERYEAIGKELRDWVGRIAPKAAVSEERLQRKATVTTLPTAAARASGKTEEADDSPSTVILQMARDRMGRFAGGKAS